MRYIYCYIFLLLVLLPNAYGDELPGIVQPGQVEKQFRPIPPLKLDQSRQVVSPIQTQTAPDNAAQAKFVLNTLDITGADPQILKDLTPIYQPFIGQEISLAVVYEIAANLVKHYRNQGYILTNVVVPAQVIENGIVTLNVVEGYVAKASIYGDIDDVKETLAAFGDKIKSSKPLRNRDLERYLLLMNDVPGITATATLRPSSVEQGASELIINAVQKKLVGGVSIDNRGGRIIGPRRINSDLTYNGLFGNPNRTTLRYVTTGDKELNYIALAHENLISDEGAKLNLQYQQVISKPEDRTAVPLNVETDSHTFELGFSYPLIRSRAQNLTLASRFDLHSGRTNILDARNSKDDLTIIRLGMNYDRQDAFQGINFVSAEYSKGIQAMGASSNDDPLLSRLDGRVDFSKATVSLGRLQGLSQHWSVLIAADAQYAFTNLLASELYSYGGEQFGRGFDPSELVGDHGWASKFELHYEQYLEEYKSSYTVYGFYDAGRVYQRSDNSDSQNDRVVTSTGIGLRLKVSNAVSAYAEVAKPINKNVDAEGDRDARIYLGVSIRI